MDNPSPEGSITILIKRIKEGDPAAVTPIWDAYFARLVSLARGRLRSVPRAVADEEDVALSAFDSFCRGVGEGRFPRLDDRDDLWQVLFMLTTRKAVGRVRYETRDRRDWRRVAQSPANGEASTDAPALPASLAGAEPTPEFAAEVAEEVSRLLGMLGDGLLRQVAILKMEGYSSKEIARVISRAESTVERRLRNIREIWEGEVDRG